MVRFSARWIVGCALCAAISGCGPTLRQAITSRTISNTRLSGVGLQVFPLGEGPEAPKMLLGFAQIQHTFSPTAEGVKVEAAPLVNRIDVAAPFGSRITDTTALGSVGEQFREGGEHLTEALEALHAPSQTILP